MRKFIDINSHFFSSEAHSTEHYRRLLSNESLQRQVICSIDLKLDASPDFPFMSCFSTSNERLWEEVQALDSVKIVPWCYIDPREADAVSQLHAWVGRGMRGVKMYPPRGFDVDDPRALRVYKAACELNIPVFLHMGRTASHPQLDSSFARPLRLERVGLACPQLRLLIGHFAAPWSREAMHIALGFPNFFFELSTSGGWDLRLLREVIELEDLGVRRLIFGTNGMGGNNLQIAEQVETRLRNAGFTESELDAIFYENARREIIENSVRGTPKASAPRAA
jgi:predicted TIM-barrel fold metal-dependent hydrolase